MKNVFLTSFKKYPSKYVFTGMFKLKMLNQQYIVCFCYILRLSLDSGVPLLATTEVTTAPCLDPCMVAGECGRKEKVE